jgi:Tol biopolymer transport system component/DNA-binding winged helix-turn-helix (wHTH) protein
MGKDLGIPVTDHGNDLVSFGSFEADLRTGELQRNGSKVRLQEQPFQLLTVLLEKPGEIVTREELRHRLWPADTFVDFDHGLNAAVKRLRDALGDSAENPRFVETLPRRGYRFVAPVTGRSTGTSSNAKGPAVPTARTRRHWSTAFAVAGFLLMGTGAGWVAARRLSPPVRVSEQRLTANPSDDPVLKAVISPDGKYLAFADRTGLFLRIIGTGETHSLQVSDGSRTRPASWFPDGSHLLATVFGASGEAASLWSISVLGGSPRKLMDNADARSVSPDGSQIAFVRGEPLNQEIWVMSANGERSGKVVGDQGDVFGAVAWSRDGRRLAFVRYTYKSGYHWGSVSLWICRPDSGRTNMILSDVRLGDGLAWAPDGRLVYSLDETPGIVNYSKGDSNLWALQVNPSSDQPVGEAKRLTNGPDRKTGLSFSSDGKKLAFLRWNGEAHVYVSQIQADASRLSIPQRLGLDEGRNHPYTWTQDSKFILFTSDRDGPSHLFKQGISQPAPDLLVGGEDSALIARLNPDGSEVLYLLLPSANGTDKRLRLMRMPLAGGTPHLVLREEAIDNFQCARAPSTVCVFGQSSETGLRFFTFDPQMGKGNEVAKMGVGLKYNWSLSPDGATLALAQWRHSQIELISTRGGPSRTLTIRGWAGVASIDWAADGRSLWASSSSPTGTQALLNIDLRGRVKPMFQDPDKDVGWAIPSPDGRYIAFWEAGGSANAWVLQGF